MKILFISFFLLLISFLPSVIFAVDCTDPAIKTDPKYAVECAFGTISPPPAIKDFLGGDKTGAGGISQFLSNLVILIYSLAAIVLIFMILWGAFEWLTSGGDKEAIAKARSRILNAFIGIILFAVAFAVITVLGQFTGFKFFTHDNSPETCRNQCGTSLCVWCTNHYQCGITDPAKCP